MKRSGASPNLLAARGVFRMALRLAARRNDDVRGETVAMNVARQCINEVHGLSLSRHLVFSSVMTFRVLGPHERGRFAPEAWGHLLSLRGAGVLSAGDFEHVVDRALAQFDGRIALDDLRALLEGAGFNGTDGPDGARVH